VSGFQLKPPSELRTIRPASPTATNWVPRYATPRNGVDAPVDCTV
jgi:hypothetical protein